MFTGPNSWPAGQDYTSPPGKRRSKPDEIWENVPFGHGTAQQFPLGTFFSPSWDYESEFSIGVNHFQLMTVSSFMWKGLLDFFPTGKCASSQAQILLLSYYYHLRGVKPSQYLDLPSISQKFPSVFARLVKTKEFWRIWAPFGGYFWGLQKFRTRIQEGSPVSLILQVALLISKSSF